MTDTRNNISLTGGSYNPDTLTYSVDIEIKARREVSVSAEGITEAEEKVMCMFEDDEISFTNSDVNEISITAHEIRYPFQNLYDKELNPDYNED